MAKGWESKSVEAQIEEAERRETGRINAYLSPEQAETFRKKEGIRLSMARVRRDLEKARNPRYQSILREALSHLEQELAELEKGRGPAKA